MTKPERNGEMYSTKIGYIAYIANIAQHCTKMYAIHTWNDVNNYTYKKINV